MFRVSWKGFNLVEYKCPSRSDGTLTLALAFCFAIVFGGLAAIYDITSWKTIALVLGFVALVALYGAYLRWWKKTPQERTVVLGSWGNRLYVRSKTLFVVYEVAIMVVLYILFTAVLVLVSNDFTLNMNDWLQETGNWLFVLLFALEHVKDRYVDYYEYYRLPDSERSMAFK